MSERPALTSILKLLLPQTPLLFKTALWHSIGLNQESSKWDIKITMLVTTIRAIMSKSTSSVTRQQKLSLRDPGIEGPIWIAFMTMPIAGDDIRQTLFTAIDDLKSSDEEHFDKCDLLPVEAEWTGYRANVSADATLPPNSTPEALYDSLTSEASSSVVILYFHGGAHYLMDPSSHRATVSALCKHAGGARALNVRYRLSPKHPFPAAILDSLVAYLNLVYPAQGAMHKAIDPADIVFAGDSAGGNISLALLALLLHLNRKSNTNDHITFNGHAVPLPLPLPGGVATTSPWVDFTRSCPSLASNAHYDYLPLPSVSLTATPASAAPTASPSAQNAVPTTSFTTSPLSNRAHQPGETKNPFPCELWPEVPPRADIYTHGSMLTHPLVSPLSLPPSAWKGSPALFFEVGEEMLSDEGNCIARRAAQAGVMVRWMGFEAMPHVFAPMFAGVGIAPAAAELGIKSWGEWIGGIGKGVGSSDIRMVGGTWVEAMTLKQMEADVQGLAGHLSDEECWARMREEKRRRCDAFAKLVEKETVGRVLGNGATKL